MPALSLAKGLADPYGVSVEWPMGENGQGRIAGDPVSYVAAQAERGEFSDQGAQEILKYIDFIRFKRPAC